ncbi:hypothetical protein G6F32_015567 [Rhizopus arrhizus]|nr:hypothetical protein G6F32_015567 [Rhizopus arrhizus]
MGFGGSRAFVRQRFFLREFLVGHEVLRVLRPDRQVAQEAHDQHARQDVHGDVVDLRARHADRQLVFADVVHQHGAEDARRRPCRQQAAVDGAHHLRAEQVGQVGRHRGEPAAVHGQDHAERRHEQRQGADVRGPRDGGIQDEAQDQEDQKTRPPM